MTIEDRQIWFNVAMTAGLGPAAAQKVARYLDDHRLAATALVDLDAEALQRHVGLSAGVASALLAQLHDPVGLPQVPDGVELLISGDDRYPNARCRDANPPLPPVLWAAADTSLLTHSGPALAVAGSRDTTEDILELVQDIASIASRQGWMVVSGLAQGVDSAAHRGALIGRTGTIGVLASGVANTSRSWMPDDTDSICIVSQFSPDEPWSGPRAMQRNATIAGLADRVFVAAAGTSGGSWEMAQLCLKRRKPLFVLDLDADLAAGNQALIRAGATSVDPTDPESVLSEFGGPMTLFG
jgi:DNA processing protein